MTTPLNMLLAHPLIRAMFYDSDRGQQSANQGCLPASDMPNFHLSNSYSILDPVYHHLSLPYNMMKYEHTTQGVTTDWSNNQ